MSFDSFVKTAQRLATNPLGIIALFIVLVYGIAGVVFGTSAQYLETSQKNIVVYFLVLFPVLVLAVFVLLVTRHHTKLYAPKDFQDASTFLRTLSFSEQKQKIEKEIDEIVSIPGDLGSPVASEKGVPQTDRDNLRKKVYLIEDLVIRDIEDYYAVSIARQVAFSIGDVGIDGMFSKGGEGYGVEVKYTRKPLSRSVIDQISYYKKLLRDRFGWRRFNFILAVVYDGLSPDEIERDKKRILGLLPADESSIELRLYDYNALIKKYGIESNG